MHFKMLSAICFSLDQFKNLLSGNWLNLYLTFLSFDSLGRDGFWKGSGIENMVAKKKMLVTCIFFFHHNVFKGLYPQGP